MKKRALISVSDKRGAAELAAGLVKLGYEIISTGGTARELKKAGIEVTGVSEITGFPECLDGRVKTLHPAVHAGLLAVRNNESHLQQLEKLKIGTIDVVAVNLYPFKETILKPDVGFEEAVENIDIGGPAMLRSAAKNSQDVLVLTDPADYLEAMGRLKSGTADKEYRLMLMYKAFQHTATYDTLIADYLRKRAGITYPDQLTAAFVKKQNLRYGENPHQSAAFYSDVLPVKGSLASAKQLQGKELSFNNINDAGAALELLREFSRPAAVAVKHTNPCGCAEGDDVYDAYRKAYECDPVSIYGGIVAVNREVDERLAAELVKIFLEILIAPSFTQGALGFLKVKPNLRVLKIADMDGYTAGIDLKKVSGGLLVQSRDVCLTEELKVVTKTQPSEQQLRDMMFAYKIVKHVKSNAIVLAAGGAAVGVGEGQTNRIWAAKQAIEHAGEKAKGSVMASDAFFPFTDCVETAAAGGITAIIQPGGSIRDGESIEACDRLGIAMVFTDCRHFKH